MECLFCEVFLAECLQVCRSYFATLCDDLLHLERPPRESFNRWVMDYFSVASCPMDDGENFCSLPLSALRKASSAHSLVPETLYDETQHMLGCCQNIASNGIGSHLFWELLDDLPFPIHLPPLSRKKVFPSTHQKRTEIKRVRRKPPTHTLFIDASQPQSSASKKFLHTNRKPFGLSRNHCKPPLSSLDIYDSLAYTVALLLRRSISECDHTSSRVASQLRYLLYGVVSAKEDSSCCFALEWMSLVLSQLSEESTEPQKPISLYERTWVKELVARGYLRLPKKTPFTTLENESTSPTDQSPTFYDPFIISLLFSLRALKRPVLIDRFAEAVIRLYCRLERFFVQVLVLGMHKQLAVTRHVHTKTWAILADKPFLHDAQTYTLCGTYICHSRNAEKIQCTPVQLIETLSESSRQDHCCVVLVWATAHVKNAYLVVRVNLSTMRRSWKRYLRTDERDRTDVVSSFAVPFLGRLTKMILRYKALTGPEEGGRGLQAALPGKVWTILLQNLHVELECFASPLNAYLPSFFSMFPDTDVFFGSKGSFFSQQQRLLSGSYQLNPPFAEAVLERMAILLLQWLQLSETEPSQTALDFQEATGKTTAKPSELPGPLSFALIVPNWDNGQGCRFLETLQSIPRFVAAKLSLTPLQHRYISFADVTSVSWLSQKMSDAFSVGDNNIQLQQAFQAVGPSVLFILQNKPGREKWPVDVSVLRELEDAWK